MKISTQKSFIYGTKVHGVQVYLKTNPGWLVLHLTPANFHGPKPVRATEILLYFGFADGCFNGS